MGAALTLAGIGVLLTLFFGLGGVDLAFGAKDKLDTLINRRTEETETTRRKSERDAEEKDRMDESVPKSRKITNRTTRAEDKTIAQNIKETAAKTKREIEDAAKLDKRNSSKPAKTKAFKKSGEEIVRQKKIQELKAKDVLKNDGATFGGQGKFGREKLNVNKNFDLGLPSTATEKDRAAVIAAAKERSAARKAAAAKKNNIEVGEKQLQGKSKAELLAIAKKRGLNFNTNISAKSLTRALLATGGL